MNVPANVLPYGRQTIDDDDVAAVAAALRDDFLTTGPRVPEFEKAFAEVAGASHAVACNSGTAALHLAALGVGLGPGDAAIVPSVTFLATANAVRMTGAEVVFADVHPDTGLLTPQTLSEAIERAKPTGWKLRAALPVHLNGQFCDMEGLAAVARPAGLQLVEDACHALGPARAGACEHSAAACFSTHPVKAITTAEGGVVTAADPALAERMRRFRSHGMVREADQFENAALAFDGNSVNPWYYEMHEIGWNYRLPDVLCALGINQLKKLERLWGRRREIAALYDRLLAPLAPVLRPVACHGEGGWHLYAVLIEFADLKLSRAAVMKALQQQRIGSQVHYIPVHQQPYYKRRYGEAVHRGADRYYARCLSIPFYASMTDDDVHRVADALSRLTGKRA